MLTAAATTLARRLMLNCKTSSTNCANVLHSHRVGVTTNAVRVLSVGRFVNKETKVMEIYQTVKRTVRRAVRQVSMFGYRNTFCPTLTAELDSGYRVHITYRELACMVREADKYANQEHMSQDLKNWRELR
jgi:hypothetical protein